MLRKSPSSCEYIYHHHHLSHHPPPGKLLCLVCSQHCFGKNSEHSLPLQVRNLSPCIFIFVVFILALNSLRCEFTELDYVCDLETKSRQEVGLGDKTSSPPLNDSLPPTRLHLLKLLGLSTTVPQAEDQAFKRMSLFGGHFTFKTQQIVFHRLASNLIKRDKMIVGFYFLIFWLKNIQNLSSSHFISFFCFS